MLDTLHGSADNPNLKTNAVVILSKGNAEGQSLSSILEKG